MKYFFKPIRPKWSIVLLLGIISFCAPVSMADDLTQKVNIDFAFEQLRTNGAIPFGKALFASRRHLIGRFALEYTKALGEASQYVGYEVLSRKMLSRQVERVLIVVYYEEKPIWVRLDAYENTKNKEFISYKVSESPNDVLQADLLYGVGS